MEDKKIVTTGDWILTLILTNIPIVNIIMWIVWLCSSETPASKKNYLKANIILWIICVVLIIVLSIISALLGIDVLSQLS